jgi:gas vesicle protein
MERHYTNTIGIFLAGVAIGCAIGVLYAPRSGKETRQMLHGRVENAKHQIEQAKENAIEAIKKAKNAKGSESA